jgi:hypothetical protein
MARSTKRLAVLVLLAALGLATPTNIAGQDPCSQACPFINCTENVPPGCRELGWCDCFYYYYYFYNAAPCQTCADGWAYYSFGWWSSPPCQDTCYEHSDIRQCLICG